MKFHRSFRDTELRGDLFGFVPLSQKHHDVALARRKQFASPRALLIFRGANEPDPLTGFLDGACAKVRRHAALSLARLGD